MLHFISVYTKSKYSSEIWYRRDAIVGWLWSISGRHTAASSYMARNHAETIAQVSYPPAWLAHNRSLPMVHFTFVSILTLFLCIQKTSQCDLKRKSVVMFSNRLHFITWKSRHSYSSSTFLGFCAYIWSKCIVHSAAEDIEQVEHIRSLLEDLQNVRQDKIRSGLCKISNDVQSGGTAYAIQVKTHASIGGDSQYRHSDE